MPEPEGCPLSSPRIDYSSIAGGSTVPVEFWQGVFAATGNSNKNFEINNAPHQALTTSIDPVAYSNHSPELGQLDRPTSVATDTNQNDQPAVADQNDHYYI